LNIAITTTVSLLVVASIVALIARRLALPYTVGLVVTGIGLALTCNDMGVVLTHEFIFDVILPPLLFESAINRHWKDLRRDALPILLLALIGTIVSAGTVTTGMVLVLGWQIVPALLFGVFSRQRIPSPSSRCPRTTESKAAPLRGERKPLQ
jgi:monovalent cation:H+ antiporter, CPA1 family